MSKIQSSAEDIVINADGSGNDISIQSNAAEKLKLTAEGNLHLQGSDSRIQLNAQGGANTVGNNTVHVRGDTVNMKLMTASGGDYIYEVNGSEKMRLKSDGKLGIGTTAPLANSLLHIQNSASSGVSAITNGLLIVENNTGVGIGLLSNNDRQQTIAFGDPQDNNVGFINYGHDTNQMSFNVNASERFRITANGVTFNGDTAAANALDDYEEGTWTPVFNGSGGSTVASYSGNSYNYTKIGNTCTILGYFHSIAWASITNGTYLQLAGLPFAASGYAGVSTPYSQGNLGGFYVESSGTVALFLNKETGAEFLQAQTVPSGNRMMLSLTYRTT